MSRIEKNEPAQQHMGALKEEVIQEMKQHQKKKGPFFSCLLFLLIVCFILGGWIAWVVASTGLVQIPVFSTWAFSTIEPTRVVLPGKLVETEVPELLKTELIQRFLAGGGKIQNRTITLSLKEQSLTASIQALVKNSSLGFFRPQGAQIAVLEGKGFELFLPIDYQNTKTALKADIETDVVNGGLQLRLKDVWIGKFRAPTQVIAWVVQPYINQELASLNNALGSYMSVERVQYGEGVVTLSGLFQAEVKY